MMPLYESMNYKTARQLTLSLCRKYYLIENYTPIKFERNSWGQSWDVVGFQLILELAEAS